MKTLLLLFLCLFTSSVFSQHYFLFIGTYTSGKSKGIYVYDFNAANGQLKWISNTDSSANPSFLTIAPDGKHIYAVNEISRQQAGLVVAYDFNPQTGKLQFINQQTSGSENPCHISITKNGKWLAVANYTGGSLAVFPINKNGSVEPFVQHIKHEGKSVNPQRQEAPHVHSAFFSPDNHFLLTPDLGIDQVSIYKFTADASMPLTPAPIPYAATEPGSGPRHLDFSPNEKYLYLLTEMGGAITVYNYNNGQLKPVQTIATHPKNFTGQPGSADIHVSPDGKFVYASNRGEENNIAIYSVNQQTGLLKFVGYEPTGGNHPRNFMIDPTGNYLLVANMKSDNILIFKRDKDSGLLTEVNHLDLPNPVCLKMLAK